MDKEDWIEEFVAIMMEDAGVNIKVATECAESCWQYNDEHLSPQEAVDAELQEWGYSK